MNISSIGHGQISDIHLHWLIVPQNQFVSVSDIVTFSDILSKNIGRFLSEGVTISESIGKNVNKGISDVISIVENASSTKTIAKYINDTMSMTENSVMTKDKPQLEFMNFTDTIAKTITKIVAVSDSIILGESVGKGLVTRPVSDAISVVDTTSIQTYRNFVRTVIDVLSSGDSISKQVAKILIENPGMTDIVGKALIRLVSDGIISGESISKTLFSLLLEQTRTIRPKGNNNIDAEGTLV